MKKGKQEKMNKQEMDILSVLRKTTFVNQKNLSEQSGHSIGIVNKAIRNLMQQGYLSEDTALTKKAENEFKMKSPKNAIILAAGYGMRMVPINMDTPKALLEINGETLIERTIKQLHEVGITDISVVVGFLKERFEYLIDEYGVNLIVNTDYSTKNNLHSLNLAAERIQNTYIIPSDVWCDKNPYREDELYSWYMVSDLVDNESDVRVNRKMELVSVPEMTGGNAMIGISYLVADEAKCVKERLRLYDEDKKYVGSFWEETLYEKDRMIVQARVVHSSDVVEINTYEQLREIDEDSNHLKSDALEIISNVFGVNQSAIINIEVLKKGMTNRSFLFHCKNEKYIMRIPGEGTDQLINRKQEADVYTAIAGYNLCDEPVYLNAEKGYKITRYIENVRNLDANNEQDLQIGMEKLREFHKLKLRVKHEFDIFDQIEFYESLWNGKKSVYKDYPKTKENVFSLKTFIDKNAEEFCLTHIDAVPDNFLFEESGEEKVALQLTDWEYAGMQDPHVDIAMFCIYSLYDKKQIDHLIEIYFKGQCPQNVHTKIYCYIAACGLLWSNWCEYKSSLGVEFGEYSIRQYRYAKDYYKLAMNEMLNVKKG